MQFIDAPFAQDPLNPVTRIASMLCDPQNNVVERFKDSFSTTKSAVAQPENQIRVQWNYASQPNTANLQGLPLTDFAVFAFRDPIRSVVYSALQPSAASYYNYVGRLNYQLYTLNPKDEVPLEFLYFEPHASKGNWKPHGNILGVGKNLGRVGVWIDAIPAAAQSTATMYFGEAVVAANSVTMVAYKFVAGRWLQGGLATVTTAATSVQIQITASGYWAFEISNQDSIAHTTSSFEIESSTSLGLVWAHLGLNQLMPTNAANVQSMRMLAVSLWLQNNASPLNQQGTLVSAQLLAGQDWFGTFVSQVNTYNAIAAVESDSERRLQKGYYGFLKPSKREDFDYMQPFEGLVLGTASGSSTLSMPKSATFDLNTPNDYLGMCASCSVQGGGDANITIATATEFRTQNDWYGQAPPTASTKDWEEALAAVATMRQHWDNDIHVAGILKTIGQLGAYAGPALSLFGPEGAVAGAVVTGLAKGAGALGEYLDNRKKRAAAAQQLEVAQGGRMPHPATTEFRAALKKLRR